MDPQTHEEATACGLAAAEQAGFDGHDEETAQAFAANAYELYIHLTDCANDGATVGHGGGAKGGKSHTSHSVAKHHHKHHKHHKPSSSTAPASTSSSHHHSAPHLSAPSRTSAPGHLAPSHHAGAPSGLSHSGTSVSIGAGSSHHGGGGHVPTLHPIHGGHGGGPGSHASSGLLHGIGSGHGGGAGPGSSPVPGLHHGGGHGNPIHHPAPGLGHLPPPPPPPPGPPANSHHWPHPGPPGPPPGPPGWSGGGGGGSSRSSVVFKSDPSYYAPPAILCCGPGAFVLEDGSCVYPDELPDWAMAEAGARMAAARRPTVGGVAPGPLADGALLFDIGGDGVVDLPDGTLVNAWGLRVDSPYLQSAMVGAGQATGVAPAGGVTGQNCTQNTASTQTVQLSVLQSTPSAATTYGQQTDWAWTQLDTAMVTCAQSSTAVNGQLAAFIADYEAWTQFYQGATTTDAGGNPVTNSGWQNFLQAMTTDPTGTGYEYGGLWWNWDTINQYQVKLAQWWNVIHAACPAAPLPCLPGPVVDANGDPLGLAPLTSAIQWAIAAVAVGVGIWFLWPVLVGAKGALAGLI